MNTALDCIKERPGCELVADEEKVFSVVRNEILNAVQKVGENCFIRGAHWTADHCKAVLLQQSPTDLTVKEVVAAVRSEMDAILAQEVHTLDQPTAREEALAAALAEIPEITRCTHMVGGDHDAYLQAQLQIAEALEPISQDLRQWVADLRARIPFPEGSEEAEDVIAVIGGHLVSEFSLAWGEHLPEDAQYVSLPNWHKQREVQP